MPYSALPAAGGTSDTSGRCPPRHRRPASGCEELRPRRRYHVHDLRRDHLARFRIHDFDHPLGRSGSIVPGTHGSGKPVLSTWSRQSGVGRWMYTHIRPASSTCIQFMAVTGRHVGPGRIHRVVVRPPVGVAHEGLEEFSRCRIPALDPVPDGLGDRQGPVRRNIEMANQRRVAPHGNPGIETRGCPSSPRIWTTNHVPQSRVAPSHPGARRS